MSITKIAYGEPRMFWHEESIKPDECTAEYGNPSGHTLLAIGYPIFLWLDVFENRERREQYQERMTKSSIFALLCAVLWSFAVGIARLYVRVHSWNQIVFGWQLGLWVAFYFHFCIRDELIYHVNTFSQTSRLDPSTRNKLILLSTMLNSLMIATLMIAFLLREKYENDHKDIVNGWIQMIESKCPNKRFGKNRFFAVESIVMSGLCGIAYGAYLGIIAYREKAGRVWPRMLETSVKASLLRYLLHVVIPIPLAGIMFISTANWPVPVQIIFQGFLPLTIVGFLLTFAPLLISKRTGLMNIDS